MRGENLGELEELVLLTIGIIYQEAYGVSIREELHNQTGRSINISAIHSVLRRLEEKGFVESYMGGSTADRGGRRKRLFSLTALGKQVLKESVELRNRMYSTIPKFAWDIR